MEKLLYKYPITFIIVNSIFFIISIATWNIVEEVWISVLFGFISVILAILHLVFSPAIGIQLAEDNNLPNKWFWGLLCFSFPVFGILRTRKEIREIIRSK